MKAPLPARAGRSLGLLVLAGILSACVIQPASDKPRLAMFVGVDSSGSFHQSGYYDNAMSFLAYYLYGHLNDLGGLSRPRELFVGGIGGKAMGEPKSFHPIHDLEGKSIEEIEAALREWFPPTDTLTDFNSFFKQVGRIAKERNLTLAPITVMVVTDGIPDVTDLNAKAGSKKLYEKIDVSPMEYLSKNLTLRVAYADPKVSEHWRKFVPHQRIRMWTVDAEVMKGWTSQVAPEADPAGQTRLWKWVLDNVDYRVRSRPI